MTRRKVVILIILVLMILGIVLGLPKLLLALLAAAGLYNYAREARINQRREIN